jgi:malate synthase
MNSSAREPSDLLTPEAVQFLTDLHRQFEPVRKELLARRAARQLELDRGLLPDLLPDTDAIRTADWRVPPPPADLDDRRVEITGPVERKMMINALNSGANVFMADFEDSLSPTWSNVLDGQRNLISAIRRELEFNSPEGKSYRLGEKLATLVVRPRGWHLTESHFQVDDEPISASLFDFGLYFFHNARELIKRGTAPYFYLPKMESHLEARLWHEVFKFAEGSILVPTGTVRATVLIETILAAFEMEEILYELGEHAIALNAGRWDYLFSAIKKFRSRSDLSFPDRGQLTMSVPFMQAYCERLVMACHRRGAHAIGGMSAFIPSRKDESVNRLALAKVREDKEREVRLGFDGTWVAHPDLVPVAREVFDRTLRGRPNQKERMPEARERSAGSLIDFRVPSGQVTEAGVRQNIDIALQYLDSWLRGIGAAAIHNLMEDAATAEISRAELWHWVRHGASLGQDGTGPKVDAALYRRFRDEELARLGGSSRGRLSDAAELLDRLVLSPEFPEFLTIPAYDLLESPASRPSLRSERAA